MLCLFENKDRSAVTYENSAEIKELKDQCFGYSIVSFLLMILLNIVNFFILKYSLFFIITISIFLSLFSFISLRKSSSYHQENIHQRETFERECR